MKDFQIDACSITLSANQIKDWNAGQSATSWMNFSCDIKQAHSQMKTNKSSFFECPIFRTAKLKVVKVDCPRWTTGRGRPYYLSREHKTGCKYNNAKKWSCNSEMPSNNSFRKRLIIVVSPLRWKFSKTCSCFEISNGQSLHFVVNVVVNVPVVSQGLNSGFPDIRFPPGTSRVPEHVIKSVPV